VITWRCLDSFCAGHDSILDEQLAEKATVLKVKAFGGEQGAKEHDPASWR
jgi:hypothetical protein